MQLKPSDDKKKGPCRKHLKALRFEVICGYETMACILSLFNEHDDDDDGEDFELRILFVIRAHRKVTKFDDNAVKRVDDVLGGCFSRWYCLPLPLCCFALLMCAKIGFLLILIELRPKLCVKLPFCYYRFNLSLFNKHDFNVHFIGS